MGNKMRLILVLGLLFLLSRPALAQELNYNGAVDSLSGLPKTESALPEPLIDKLRQGGLLIFFRHSLTPNYKGADDNDLDNCAVQRNLSKEGREQAAAIGAAFRDLEIPVGIVRASPLCRCIDTAWLAFGHYERDNNMRLHGTNPAQDEGEAKAWRNLRNIAKIPPLPGTNTVYISHGTIGEVFGSTYLDEGEAIILEPDGQGNWRVLAQVKSDQWVKK